MKKLKKSKGIISVILTLLMIVSIIPMGTISASAISESEVKTKLDSFISTYPSGSRWTGTFDGGSQCYGFGKMVIYNIFGKNSSGGYRSWTYAGVSTSGMKVIGSVTSFSSSNVQSLLSKARCGDVLQFDSTKQHTMIVYSVDSNGVTIYDCNWDNNCGISKRYCNFGVWSGRNSNKLTLLRSDNYEEPVVVTHTIDSKYSKNFTAYLKSPTTNHSVTDANHGSTSHYVNGNDPCTIHEVYTDGCCKFTYTLDSGSTRTAYGKISWFKMPTYTVKYSANGGSGAPSDQTKTDGTILTLSSTKPTRTGYTFEGWGESASATTVAYSSGTTYKNNKNITLYALWTPNKLSVNYNANGGTISSDTYKLSSNIVYKISTGEKLTQTWTYNSSKADGLYNASTFGMTKAGYTFKGWGTTASGGTVFAQDDSTLVPTSINSAIKNGNCSSTLYAVWEANTYTVQYNANGGTGTTASSSHTYDTAKALTANGFTRTGYTFLGWSTNASATAVTYTDKQSVKNLTATNGGIVTLYAVWQKNTVTVSSIAVNAMPSKTVYTVGETFSSSGLSIKVNMSDGTSNIVTNGFTVSSPDMSTAGTKTVTVTYQGKTATFPITVKAVDTNNPSIKIDAGKAVCGQQVNIPVIVEKTDLGTLTIDITYDSSKLNIASISEIPFDMYDTNTKTPGKIRITATGNASVPAGKVAVLTFDVIATSSCSTDISITVDEAYDANDKTVELTPLNGVLEILKAVPGDVNGDGKVSAIDARMALQYNAGNKELTAEQIAAADVNGDGKVSAIDARWILQAVAGNREL